MLHKLDSWHKTKAGYISFSVLELGLSFMFMNFSIDRGNLWDYMFTVLFLVGSVQNLFKFLQEFRHV